MSLKETINEMSKHLSCLIDDLEKVIKGNKAACQRVRTGTIRFGKVAKCFRKESISAEKSGSLKKTKTTKVKKSKAKKIAKKKKNKC